MIKGQIKLEFGNGDIGITLGYGCDDLAFLAFKNIKKRKMGEFFIDPDDNIENYSIMMTFKNGESIEVLIKALEEIKKYIERPNEMCICNMDSITGYLEEKWIKK